ncbi:MAG: DNA internalization-related competence protein ComEC/Rec2 [Firmicutes bacterium]|nr:DNA internalization-related competence protein ComEC/Rec2 [Bacillota bacterium]
MPLLPFLAAAFAAGIALGNKLQFTVWIMVMLGSAALIATMFLSVKKKSAAVGLLLLFMSLGMMTYQAAYNAIHIPLKPLLEQQGYYCGYIKEVLKQGEDNSQFTFYIEEFREKDGKCINVGTEVLVRVYQQTAEFEPSPGLRLSLLGRLTLPAGQRNPGGFNYANYLAAANIGAHMTVNGWDVLILPGFGGSRFLSLMAKTRSRAVHIFKHHLPAGEGGLAAGILLGEKDELREETLTAYQRLGLAHILSVSGLHVGFVASFATFLFQRLCGTRRFFLYLLLSGIFILAYVFLTGANPPVWRAALSWFIALAARKGGRESSGLQVLSIVTLLMLFWRPLWLFSLSFQLSFAATFAILLLAPRLEGYFSRLPKSIGSSLAVTLAAMAGVLPLQLQHFGYLSLFTLPLNLLCVPLVGIVVIISLLGMLCGLIFLPLAAPFLITALPFLAFLDKIPCLCAALPLGTFYIPTITPLWRWFYTFLLIMIVTYRKWRPAGAKLLLLLLCAANFVLLFSFSCQGRLSITFLDVGQGLAVHIQTPAGRHLFFDAGGSFSAVGEQIILPYLRRHRVDQLVALILSHPHQDHYGGMPAILSTLPTEIFIYNGQVEESSLYHGLQQLLAQKQIPSFTLHAGYSLQLDGMQLQIISPGSEFFYNTGDDVNNNSLVMKLTYKNFSLLLMGDTEKAAVAQLLQLPPKQLQANVLQVPHHGSREALSAALLAAVRPQAAVISVGSSNAFGHPHADTLDLLKQQYIDIFRTDYHGAVTIESDGKGWQTKTFLHPLF